MQENILWIETVEFRFNLKLYDNIFLKIKQQLSEFYDI